MAYRLSSKNYVKWSQLTRTILKGYDKLSHLLATSPKTGDPKFDAWDEEDSMVMSWLWNFMTLEISNTCMFLGSTKVIWDFVQQTYSKYEMLHISMRAKPKFPTPGKEVSSFVTFFFL